MGNEKLITPEPVVDTTVALAEEAGYTYQRADGTVERALNADDAIARCPVLGKLAIEAPDQANMLLELATAGKVIMTAEAKVEPRNAKTVEKVEVKKVDWPTPAKQLEAKPEKIRKLEPISTVFELTKDEAQPVLPNIVAHSQVEQVRQQTPSEKPPNVTKNAAKKPAPIQTDESSIIRRIRQEESTASSRTKPVKASGLSHDEASTLPKLQELELQKQRWDKTTAQQSMPAEAQYVERIARPLEPIELDHKIAAEAYISVNSAVIKEEDQLELLFEPETIETFQQLTALITDKEAYEITPPDTEQVVADTSMEFETRTYIEMLVAVDFENFIASQPAAEEPLPLTLEVIQEQANQHPLEQTLVQLSIYLSELDETGLGVLAPVIKDIEKLLPACYVYKETTRSELKPHITPEMIEKLLALLRILGYQNPREALMSCVSRYNLVFLLQALEYISQLNNVENKKDFLITSATSISADDGIIQLRLGKLLFGLIAKLNPAPSI